MGEHLNRSKYVEAFVNQLAEACFEANMRRRYGRSRESPYVSTRG